MSRSRHRRKKRRAKRQGLHFGWLSWVLGGLAIVFFGLGLYTLAERQGSAAASPTPDFTPTPYPTPVAPEMAGDDPDLGVLAAYMLELINVDRVANGLQPVAWDALAARVGRLHAEEMAAAGYMSHWNLAGLGPDIRYSLAGGRDAVMENVHSYYQRYDDGRPIWVTDWAARVREAQEALMNSPGHRANILTPEHTYVGVGMAYDPETGEFRLAQEFLNRYTAAVGLEALPTRAHPGESFAVQGALLPGATQPLINLDFELLPQPMTIGQLNATSTYTSPAEFVEAIEPRVDRDGNFTASVILPRDEQPGYYHVRVWVQVNGESVLTSDTVVELIPEE